MLRCRFSERPPPAQDHHRALLTQDQGRRHVLYIVRYIDFYEKDCWLYRACEIDHTHVPPKLMGRRRLLKHMKSLSGRERQIVLTLAAGGLSNRDVGRQLSLSEGTVKAHLHNIYKKLGINSRTALVVMAHTHREELQHSLP